MSGNGGGRETFRSMRETGKSSGSLDWRCRRSVFVAALDGDWLIKLIDFKSILIEFSFLSSFFLNPK